MSISPVDGFDSKKSWPEGAVEDWQHGASYSWLANKYGRAYSTIAHHIRFMRTRYDLKPVVDLSERRQGGRQTFAEQSPISQFHRNVGVKLNYYREVINDLNYEELGAKLGVNRLVTRKMELGIHDFTLTQLEAVAGLLETAIPELMKPGAK
ncbi:hypothetical protein [Aurantimonas manganoxydans]|nr:hypothetical protein [Aurantimonas manganoxydans]